MSWDVFLFSVPDDVVARDETPDYDTVRSLGTRQEVLSVLKEVVPEADFGDPERISLLTETFAMHIRVGEEEPIDHVSLEVRGGEEVLGVIEKLCEATGWHAWDTSTGSFIDFSGDPGRGLRAFHRMLDYVRDQLEREGEEIIWPTRRRWWER